MSIDHNDRAVAGQHAQRAVAQSPRSFVHDQRQLHQVFGDELDVPSRLRPATAARGSLKSSWRSPRGARAGDTAGRCGRSARQSTTPGPRGLHRRAASTPAVPFPGRRATPGGPVSHCFRYCRNFLDPFAVEVVDRGDPTYVRYERTYRQDASHALTPLGWNTFTRRHRTTGWFHRRQPTGPRTDLQLDQCLQISAQPSAEQGRRFAYAARYCRLASTAAGCTHRARSAGDLSAVGSQPDGRPFPRHSRRR